MKSLFKSLADFQQEVPVIHKDTQGYNYSYADLPTIFEVINPLLKKHGLGFYQAVNGTDIKTVVFHVESGETIESVTAIPQGVQMNKMNDFQVLGSAITYIRRYAISSLLGLVTDKDTDGAGEQVKTSPKTAKNASTSDKKIDYLALAKNSLEKATTDEEVAEVKKKVEASTNLTEQEKQFMYDEIVLKLEGIPFK